MPFRTTRLIYFMLIAAFCAFYFNYVATFQLIQRNNTTRATHGTPLTEKTNHTIRGSIDKKEPVDKSVGTAIAGETDLTSLQLRARNIINKTEPELPSPPNTLGAFIHVGETQGLKLSKQLLNGCHSWVSKPCPRKKYLNHPNAVSKLTTYYHTADFEASSVGNGNFGDSEAYKNALRYEFFLFTVRDPFERAVSSFLTAHPENYAKDMYTTVERIAKTRKYKPYINLYRCFPTLESYAIALKNVQEYKSEDWNQFSEHEEYCSNVAKMTMNHQIEESMAHQYWDLRRILYEFREVDFRNTTLLLVRDPNLQEDWSNVNQYLGEEGNVTVPKTCITCEGKDYPVKNVLSEEARKMLCFAVEDEYKVYLKLLQYAANLRSEDVSESLELSRNNCPWLQLSLPNKEKRTEISINLEMNRLSYLI